MAKAPTRPAEQEAEVVDPKGAMARLAELTRRVIAVPKEEVPAIFAKPKKRAKRKRRH
jgi:hypothetical protein